MRTFIIRRIIYGLAVVWLVSFIVFGLSRAAGDPRDLYIDEYTTTESWEAMGREMGLDKPLIVQYMLWFGNALTGDFGRSLYHRTSARAVIGERIRPTLELTLGGLIFAVITGFPLGVLSAVKRGSAWDYIGRTFALYGQALPAFWLGVMLILIFSVQLKWLPTSQRGDWTHFILPGITLGWGASAAFVRLVRSSMLEVLDSEFVVLARAKGVATRWIIWKHAFRNALIAPMTFAGVLLAAYLTGAVVTETVFAWPGLGRLAVQSVFNNDFPIMTGVVMIFAGFFVIANFIVDLLYSWADPRIRLE